LYFILNLDEIPEEESAIQVSSLSLPGQRTLPPHISNQVQDLGDGQKMVCRFFIFFLIHIL
jgi:hypothetical protein